jgi:hypothetical protein
MKATGDTPAELAKDISGSLELLEFYVNDRTVFASAASNNVIGTGPLIISGLTVPNGEIWLLFDLSLSSANTPAATGFTLTGGVQRAVNNYFAYTERQVVGGGAVSDQVNVGRHFDRPIVMQPGETIGLRISQIVGAPGIPVTASVYYAPLKI